MPFLPLLLGHLKIAGYIAAALAVALFIGWIGHLRHTIEAQQTLIALQGQQLATAKQVNDQTLAALDRIKAEAAKTQAALADELATAQARAASVASIHEGIAHVAPKPGPASAVGPYSLYALDRLRQLKAGRADKGPGRKGADPAGAAGVPARP